jgi:hypothetical protein
MVKKYCNFDTPYLCHKTDFLGQKCYDKKASMFAPYLFCHSVNNEIKKVLLTLTLQICLLKHISFVNDTVTQYASVSVLT